MALASELHEELGEQTLSLAHHLAHLAPHASFTYLDDGSDPNVARFEAASPSVKSTLGVRRSGNRVRRHCVDYPLLEWVLFAGAPPNGPPGTPATTLRNRLDRVRPPPPPPPGTKGTQLCLVCPAAAVIVLMNDASVVLMNVDSPSWGERRETFQMLIFWRRMERQPLQLDGIDSVFATSLASFFCDAGLLVRSGVPWSRHRVLSYAACMAQFESGAHFAAAGGVATLGCASRFFQVQVSSDQDNDSDSDHSLGSESYWSAETCDEDADTLPHIQVERWLRRQIDLVCDAVEDSDELLADLCDPYLIEAVVAEVVHGLVETIEQNEALDLVHKSITTRVPQTRSDESAANDGGADDCLAECQHVVHSLISCIEREASECRELDSLTGGLLSAPRGCEAEDIEHLHDVDQALCKEPLTDQGGVAGCVHGGVASDSTAGASTDQKGLDTNEAVESQRATQATGKLLDEWLAGFSVDQGSVAASVHGGEASESAARAARTNDVLEYRRDAELQYAPHRSPTAVGLAEAHLTVVQRAKASLTEIEARNLAYRELREHKKHFLESLTSTHTSSSGGAPTKARVVCKRHPVLSTGLIFVHDRSHSKSGLSTVPNAADYGVAICIAACAPSETRESLVLLGDGQVLQWDQGQVVKNFIFAIGHLVRPLEWFPSGGEGLDLLRFLDPRPGPFMDASFFVDDERLKLWHRVLLASVRDEYESAQLHISDEVALKRGARDGALFLKREACAPVVVRARAHCVREWAGRVLRTHGVRRDFDQASAVVTRCFLQEVLDELTRARVNNPCAPPQSKVVSKLCRALADVSSYPMPRPVVLDPRKLRGVLQCLYSPAVADAAEQARGVFVWCGNVVLSGASTRLKAWNESRPQRLSECASQGGGVVSGLQQQDRFRGVSVRGGSEWAIGEWGLSLSRACESLTPDVLKSVLGVRPGMVIMVEYAVELHRTDRNTKRAMLGYAFQRAELSFKPPNEWAISWVKEVGHGSITEASSSCAKATRLVPIVFCDPVTLRLSGCATPCQWYDPTLGESPAWQFVRAIEARSDGERAGKCVICQHDVLAERLREGQLGRVDCPFQHEFCYGCIRQSLTKRVSTCPICRAPVQHLSRFGSSSRRPLEPPLVIKPRSAPPIAPGAYDPVAPDVPVSSECCLCGECSASSPPLTH